MKKIFQPLAKALSVCAMLLALNFLLLAPKASAQPLGYNRGFFPHHPFHGGGFLPHNGFRRAGFFPHHRFQGGGLPHHRFQGGGLPRQHFQGGGLPHHRFHGGGLPYQRFQSSGFFPAHNFYLAKYKAKMQRMS